VALTWTAPTSDGGKTISGYNVYRGSSAASTSLLATVRATNFTYLDTGLTNGNSYYYKVAAINSVGVGTPTSTLLAQPNATPPANARPGPVTNVNVVIDDGKVTLKWDLPTTGGPVSYLLIYRSTGNVIPDSSLTNLSANADSYVDTNAISGQTYYYWIVPGNSNGAGPAAFSGVVNPTSNPNEDNSLLYAFIVIIAIIVIAAAVLVFMRMRKKRTVP
jgi:fibronectin type 3 domain-containing protein